MRALLEMLGLTSRRDEANSTADAAAPDAPLPDQNPCYGDPLARTIRHDLEMGCTEALESLLATLTDPDARAFYVDVLSNLRGVPQWLDAWVERGPNSPAATLFRGAHAVHWAWQARGKGYANSVGEDAWKAFFERLEFADKCLDKAAHVAPDDATPWALKIRAARGLQLDEAETKRRFDQAVRRAPRHRLAHSQMLQCLCAKWGGSDEKMFAFAETAARSAPSRSPLHVLIAEAHVEKYLALLSDSHERVAESYFKLPQVSQAIHAAAAAFAPRAASAQTARETTHDGEAGCGCDGSCPCEARREILSENGQTSPDARRAHNFFAFCLWKTGDFAAAAAHFRAVGPWMGDVPWTYTGDAVEVFTWASRQCLSGAASTPA